MRFKQLKVGDYIMPEGSNDDVQARWGLDNEKQVPWDKEKGLDADSANKFRQEILEFISDSKQSSAYLMTRRKDGREIMRPVSVFVENWVCETITQDIQPKTTHVRRDPIVGYLWVGREHRSDWKANDDFRPKVVWMQGVASLIEDESEVNIFYEKREAKKGVGRVHPEGETMHLIRTAPQYVRAEGWEGSRAIIYKNFD
ncbi:MAG: hypothetical protein DK305_000952 [Chloroflexi bacterium]|nr:MAG: hypothetical protein DK305_000952 [Chloroflexota bacterium]